MWYKAQTFAQHYPLYKQNSHNVHSANKSIPMQVQLERWPQLAWAYRFLNPSTITTPIISNGLCFVCCRLCCVCMPQITIRISVLFFVWKIIVSPLFGHYYRILLPLTELLTLYLNSPWRCSCASDVMRKAENFCYQQYCFNKPTCVPGCLVVKPRKTGHAQCQMFFCVVL